MFDNIGRRVKNFALGVFISEIIVAIISGIVMICSGEDELILWGIITIIVGPLVGWLSSFLLYAFGQLVENSDKLVEFEKYKRQQSILNPTPTPVMTSKSTTMQSSNGTSVNDNSPATQTPPDAEHKWLCYSCKKMRSVSPCPYCGGE